jgi:glycosyltransferase involved in cell wall biosynthesis
MDGLLRGVVRTFRRRFGGGRDRSRAPVCGGPRVGIITAYEAQKGIRTIARDIQWALDGRATVFPMTRLDRLDERFPAIGASSVSTHAQGEGVVAADTPIRGWLESQDIVIFIERIHTKVAAHCRARGIRTVLVALVDWLPEAATMRRQGLAAYDRVVSFSHQADELLAAEGCERVVHITPASTWSPAQAKRSPFADTLYFPVGVGGPENRRNVALVLEVFSRVRARHPDIRLIIKVVPEAYDFHPELRGLTAPGVEVVDRELDDEGMRRLQLDADICLFPSRYEGLGYPVLESLQCGVPVVATDAPPMNEVIQDGRNGLLVRAKPVGSFGLQTVWELDRDDLEATLERLLGPSGAALWGRLRRAIPGGWDARAAACRTGWRRLVAGLAPRALNVGCG